MSKASISIASKFLAGAGVVVSLALVVLATLDFGDPASSIRGRLARQAQAEGNLAFAAWRERLARPGPIADAVGSVLHLEAGQSTALFGPMGPGIAIGEEERTQLLLARAADERGDRAQARDLLECALDRRSGREFVSARLQAIRWGREAGDQELVSRYLSRFDELPWSERLRGHSVRMIALLAGADVLDSHERETRARELVASLEGGLVRFAPPNDDVRIDPRDGLVVELDPRLVAVREMLTRRLSLGTSNVTEQVWAGALAEGARTRLELEELLGPSLRSSLEESADRWILLDPHPDSGEGPGMRIAVRQTANGAISLAAHTNDQIADAISSLIPTDGPWRVAMEDRVGEPPAEVLGAPIRFEGTDAQAVVIHDDPGRAVRAERKRLSMIRAALLVLALLTALATWFAVRAAHRAARLAQLRSTFIASVSHDLRTPLAAIGTLAENLSDGVVVGEHATREYNRAIRREVDRLGRLVSGLLDFARVERGLAPRLVVENVDPVSWLDDLERAAAEHGELFDVDVVCERGPLTERLCIDADALHRAVMNLVENAVQHSGSDRVVIRSEVVRGRLVVEVCDRGSGIAESEREGLFEPYACRGDRAGTGLGLSIVRSIAEAHGGAASLRGSGGEKSNQGLTARLEVDATGDRNGGVAGGVA